MKSTLVNMVLSLGIITIVAAAALAGVYTLTEEPIAQAKAQKQKDAIDCDPLPRPQGRQTHRHRSREP